MNYPADIVNDDYGWHRIHRGHGLDRETLLADLIEHTGEPHGRGFGVQEVWMSFHPRVKNCRDFDGFGCDNEGDWHSHWFAAEKGRGEALTIAYWETTVAPSAPRRSPFLRSRRQETGVQ